MYKVVVTFRSSLTLCCQSCICCILSGIYNQSRIYLLFSKTEVAFRPCSVTQLGLTPAVPKPNFQTLTRCGYIIFIRVQQSAISLVLLLVSDFFTRRSTFRTITRFRQISLSLQRLIGPSELSWHKWLQSSSLAVMAMLTVSMIASTNCSWKLHWTTRHCKSTLFSD